MTRSPNLKMSTLEISVIDLPCGKSSNVKVSSGIWRMWQMIPSGRFMNLSRLTDRYVICNVYYYVLKKHFFDFFFRYVFLTQARDNEKKNTVLHYITGVKLTIFLFLLTNTKLPPLLIPTVCETRDNYERCTDLAHSVLSGRGLERGIRSSEVPLLHGDCSFFVISFYYLPVLIKRLSIVEL